MSKAAGIVITAASIVSFMAKPFSSLMTIVESSTGVSDLPRDFDLYDSVVPILRLKRENTSTEDFSR